MGMFDAIFGGWGGMTKFDLVKLTRRDTLSNYLPYLSYDEKSKRYFNSDDTIGFIWECAPMAFIGQQALNTLGGLFRLQLPPGSMVQFILYADEYVEPHLNAYIDLKTRQNEIANNAARSFARFLHEGRKGMKQFQGIPIRNFRLLIALKMPRKHNTPINVDDIFNSVGEMIKGASLYPQPFPPERLLDMYRRILNDVTGIDPQLLMGYDNGRELRKQLIFSETEIEKHSTYMKFGDKYFRCATPKTFPREVDALQTNELFGGIHGIASDTNQIATPFIYCLNISFKNLKTSLHTKCSLVLQQQGVGSFAPSLERKKKEYMWAVDEVEKGTPFVEIIPILWTWSEDETSSSESIARIKRLWEAQGYVMQEDRGILPILMIGALPFGLYDKGHNLESLDRGFIAPEPSVTPVLPVQSDFAGGGEPYLLFVGRKGQLATINVFDKMCNNNNIFVAAESGSGKSFMVNYLTFNYYAAGALIRIVDIGGSYKKMVNMVGARYLDFDEDSAISLNPFTFVKAIDEELPCIAALIMQMIYSATDEIPKESAEISYSIVKDAIRWAWDTKANDAEVDDIYEFLVKYPSLGGGTDAALANRTVEVLQLVSQSMAVNLKDFVKAGLYGKWFNGPCTFDISNDEFVVLELERLKPKKELFKVVTMRVVDAVTQDLYLSDRSQRRFIVFDEAWQFLIGATLLTTVIEEGYRRARKYGGSFCVVTQSLLDVKRFGAVGDVIRANSAFKFYLESKDVDKAVGEKLLEDDPFLNNMMKSTKSNRPKYSEIFIDSPFGTGVLRLAVDNYSYYVYTSDAKEISEIESLVASQGVTYAEAINMMVKKYRS